jgi:glycosyltransferase involved in cell wall biosynthesis
MKVVHLAPFVEPGYTGGMQRYVTELAREQRCAGIDASIYTLRLGEPHPHAPSPSTRRGSLNGDYLPVAGRRASFVWQRTPVHPMLVRDLGEIEADVVHLHSPSPTLEAALLLACVRRSWKASATGGTRLVVTVHNALPRTTHIQRALGRIEQSILAAVLRRADAVIMPHDAFAAEIVPHFGLIDQRPGSGHPLPGRGWGSPRLHIVPPGVDHTRFRDLGLERDPDTMLFVGHVRPEKGLHVLIEAMARLPRLRLEVVAAVSYESKYYGACERRAASILGDRVRFRQNVQAAELEEAYNRAGVVVAPSLALESWNLVLLEAASTGAACVRTQLPGLHWADFAVEARTGDAESLANAIEAAIARREELGCWGKQRANEYSWERTCRETLAAYVAA